MFRNSCRSKLGFYEICVPALWGGLELFVGATVICIPYTKEALESIVELACGMSYQLSFSYVRMRRKDL